MSLAPNGLLTSSRSQKPVTRNINRLTLEQTLKTKCKGVTSMSGLKLIDLHIAHRRGLLWTLAVVITVGSAYYQRRTGPTYDFRGKVSIAEQNISFRLVRTEIVGNDAPIVIDVPDRTITGFVKYKRYKSNDDWSNMALVREGDQLKANLPHQPAAGKLIYFVYFEKGATSLSITDDKPVILRYRGDVPAWIFLPHVLIMFIAMLLSNRVGLEALDSRGKPYRLMIWTIVLFIVGGFILGPLMQKYAFGAYWTGFPLGMDLTDNKTLIAMVGWIVAWFMNRKGREGRGWIVLAAVLMLAIYLIPHSVLGSELDYTKLSQ